MINAKYANALTEEMFCTGGYIRNINQAILQAVADGKPHTYLDYTILDDEILAHYANLGYTITRTVICKANGSYSYKYIISW